MGPKKGVISQSVKDVIQSLVDDDLVLKDKIGTSVNNSPLSMPSHLAILLED
jgi:Mnd1 HTH domain